MTNSRRMMTEDTKSKGTVVVPVSLKSFVTLEKEKIDLMAYSVFHPLVQLQNRKECSNTLIGELCRRYDSSSKSIKLSENASFHFCAKEVAIILDIKATMGADFKAGNTHTSLPDYVIQLLNDHCGESWKNNSKAMKPAQLKKILENMPVTNKTSKRNFKKLMSFYIVDQFLFPGSNKYCKNKHWGVVNDLKEFEGINWAKAITENIRVSLEKVHEALNRKEVPKQIEFPGCAPVLEALVYDRITKFRPEIGSYSSPKIQMFCPQRSRTWEFKSLLATDISICQFCANSTTPDIPGSVMFDPNHIINELTEAIAGTAIGHAIKKSSGSGFQKEVMDSLSRNKILRSLKLKFTNEANSSDKDLLYSLLTKDPEKEKVLVPILIDEKSGDGNGQDASDDLTTLRKIFRKVKKNRRKNRDENEGDESTPNTVVTLNHPIPNPSITNPPSPRPPIIEPSLKKARVIWI